MAEPMLPANAPVLAALALPHEYAISNAERMGIEASLHIMERRLKEGLRLLQVRDKNLPDRNGFAMEVANPKLVSFARSTGGVGIDKF